MSRLEEECVMAVVRNRSGLGAGEIDYSLMTDKFEKMVPGDLEDCLVTLKVLTDKVQSRLDELNRIPLK